jgi:signal transduction histidine kinase
MRRAQGQSERQIVRRAQIELAGLVVLLLSLFGAAAAASASARAGAAWVALLIVLGGAAVATAAWLLARLPAEMRGLARERRLAFDDLLRAEEDERERIAGELHEDTVQVLTAALVTIDRMTPAVRPTTPSGSPTCCRRRGRCSPMRWSGCAGSRSSCTRRCSRRMGCRSP